VANLLSENVSVLLGVGDGTFEAAVHYDAGGYACSLAIGDLNGNQVPDLAVATGYVVGTVAVLLGFGDGTFADAVNYDAGYGEVVSVAIGDLEGDQVPDLAVANARGDVSVLLGLGDGTLAAAVYYGTGDESSWVAIDDLDGDGWADLAVANSDSDNVSVLLNQSPTPGDLNDDGCVDQADLGILLADWGCSGGDCPGDCDGDGNTNQVDLGILLGHWGEGCP